MQNLSDKGIDKLIRLILFNRDLQSDYIVLKLLLNNIGNIVEPIFLTPKEYREQLRLAGLKKAQIESHLKFTSGNLRPDQGPSTKQGKKNSRYSTTFTKVLKSCQFAYLRNKKTKTFDNCYIMVTKLSAKELIDQIRYRLQNIMDISSKNYAVEKVSEEMKLLKTRIDDHTNFRHELERNSKDIINCIDTLEKSIGFFKEITQPLRNPLVEGQCSGNPGRLLSEKLSFPYGISPRLINLGIEDKLVRRNSEIWESLVIVRDAVVLTEWKGFTDIIDLLRSLSEKIESSLSNWDRRSGDTPKNHFVASKITVIYDYYYRLGLSSGLTFEQYKRKRVEFLEEAFRQCGILKTRKRIEDFANREYPPPAWIKSACAK